MSLSRTLSRTLSHSPLGWKSLYPIARMTFSRLSSLPCTATTPPIITTASYYQHYCYHYTNYSGILCMNMDSGDVENEPKGTTTGE